MIFFLNYYWRGEEKSDQLVEAAKEAKKRYVSYIFSW